MCSSPQIELSGERVKGESVVWVYRQMVTSVVTACLMPVDKSNLSPTAIDPNGNPNGNLDTRVPAWYKGLLNSGASS